MITDLPGIYSMSPYSSEEIVTREFVLRERPRGIINIVDATNIERNLYLTMQMCIRDRLYIYRQFISTLPVSLDESALLDGCGYFGLFVRIIFPLLAPATATVVIIKAINIINDMYIPYLYMPKNGLRTLTTFLMNYANAQQGSCLLYTSRCV